MSVVLINPPPKRIIEGGDKPFTPHLGLAYLGATLLENDVPVKVIDTRFLGLNMEETLEHVFSLSPQIVGITAMTHMIVNAHNLAEKIKTKFRDSIIVIGGVHAGELLEQTLLEFPAFDIAVRGEGENTFSELVQELLGKSKPKLEAISGIAYRQNNQVTATPARPLIEDVDSIPLPAWQLLPKSDMYPVMTQRGCPGNCNFCISGRRSMRIRSPEAIVKEMSILVKKFNAKTIGFPDNFGAGKKHAHRILDLILAQDFKVHITVSIRANMISDETLIKKLKEAGCVKVGVGVESGDPDILKKSHKGISQGNVIKAFALLKKYKINHNAYFIIGHPNETIETGKRTIDLMVKINPQSAAIGIMVPYPGTEVYDLAIQGKGGYKLISKNWEDYNKQIGNALELENFSRKQMERLQMWGYIKLYLYNLRFKDLFNVAYSNRKLAWVIIKKIFRKNLAIQ